MQREAVFQALLIAAILALAKFIRDVIILKTRVEPVIDWYVKTSMDALRIATNPTSERLMELADRYIACVTGKSKTDLTIKEKQELIDGLRELQGDKGVAKSKRLSASLSLRFIESREKLDH